MGSFLNWAKSVNIIRDLKITFTVLRNTHVSIHFKACQFGPWRVSECQEGLTLRPHLLKTSTYYEFTTNMNSDQ